MSRSSGRRDRTCKKLRKLRADALLVTNFSNVTYLSDFTGDDSYLLLTPKNAVVLSDPRYTTQLEEECARLDLHIRQPGVSMIDAVAQAVNSAGAKRIAFEADSMPVALYERLQAALPDRTFVSTSGFVEELREVKDADEVAALRVAVDQAERAFAVLRATLRGEQTEKEVAAHLEYQMRLFGARGPSFPPIVAAGPRAALPHARPTDAKTGDEDFVLVDWGADGGLYKSDLTRVLVTGRISSKLERVYRVVLNAQAQAIEAIRPGVSCHEVDQVARAVIAKAGFGKYFGHGLGHGIGLDIHEGPRLARNQHQPLRAGNVVTVEPGIYLPGWGGVRIEDDVLVTKGGHEVLTHVPKQWEEVVLG